MDIINKETLRHFVELGYSASGLPPLKKEALAIFEALQQLTEYSTAWILGTAMVYAKGEGSPQKACDYMRTQGIGADTGDSVTRAFLGLFLVEAGHSSAGEAVLNRVTEDADEAEAVGLAETILANIKRFR